MQDLTRHLDGMFLDSYDFLIISGPTLQVLITNITLIELITVVGIKEPNLFWRIPQIHFSILRKVRKDVAVEPNTSPWTFL